MSKLIFRSAQVFVFFGLTFGLGALLERVGATDFFADDFAGYVDDSELTSVGGWQVIDINNPTESSDPDPANHATWTMMNYGGRGNPATANGTASTGQFLISDSDKAKCTDATGTHECADGAGSGMSHDILSPAFSCAGAGVVWLHMSCTAQLNNNGKVVFDMDVSTDNGANWTNVFRRVAQSRVEAPPQASTQNTDGFLGRLDVDISSVAANKPKVTIRLRQFEPDDDWWIAVDDVIVDDKPAKTGDILIFCERFDSGIPDAWTVRSLADPANTGDTTWNSTDPCKRSMVRNGKAFPYLDGRGIARLDEGFAILSSDKNCPPNPAVDDYLITPVIDCSKATAVYFQYKSEIVASRNATQEVLLSLDGGNSFEATPIFTYYSTDPSFLAAGYVNTEDPFYAERVFEMPEAIGKSRVAFAFHYMSAAGNDGGWWAIDDVKVSVNGNYPVRNCCNRDFVVSKFDAGTSSISMSWRGLAGDEGFRIRVNGQQVGGDLPASARSFSDTSPPAGSPCVTYSLQSLSGGAVDFECTGPCVPVVSCPKDFVCCVNQATKAVNLRWRKGINISGTGWRITRNGLPLRTLPITAENFTDDTVPGPGAYEYQLILNGGNAAQCPGLPLKCNAVVLGGDLIFFDDFDCYSDDTALKAAGWEIHEENNPSEIKAFWTVTNPGGRDNPPTGNGVPSHGRFLISDSDFSPGDDAGNNGQDQGSGRSHDIWSPSLNCTGKTKVWLHADSTVVLNNNGLVVFDVDVSTDNGANWLNVFRRVGAARSADPLPLADIPEDLPGGPQAGNADGFFGRLDLDISAQAANKPNVRFRLRQFEPSDDWWVAVDNVLVDSNPVVGGSRVLLAEEFSGGIPGDWNVQSLDDMAPWRVEGPDDTCRVSLLHSNGGAFPDGADGRQIHHFDNYFAINYGDANCGPVINDEILGTRTLDCSGTTKVFLHFKSDIVVVNALAEVLLSLDGGASYDKANPIFSYQLGGGFYRDAGNAETAYNEYIFEVPQAANQSKVVFGFHFANGGPQNAYWGIDDVKVTVEGGGGKTFHRGDSDGNGSMQLTDAVRILNFLFLGTGHIDCMDAADADNNGTVQLTDAVRILNVLFLGTGSIPDPGPPGESFGNKPCGPDPDDKHLGCEAYNSCG